MSWAAERWGADGKPGRKACRDLAREANPQICTPIGFFV